MDYPSETIPQRCDWYCESDRGLSAGDWLCAAGYSCAANSRWGSSTKDLVPEKSWADHVARACRGFRVTEFSLAIVEHTWRHTASGSVKRIVF
jgi:hypothetical protein